MPTFKDPAVDADEAQTALRALAYATRSVDDPRQIYPVLGSLTTAVASLRQSLTQLARVHEEPRPKTAWVIDGSPSARAGGSQVSSELRRAAEILHQVSESLRCAHSAEATVIYHHRDFSALTRPAGRHAAWGLEL